MMMFQDTNNNPQEKSKNQQEEPIIEAKATPETLNKEQPSEIPATKAPDQEHLLQEHSSGQQAASQSQSQSLPPMPSDDMMRHSIADSLMEMLMNMTHSPYLHECLELLEASDPLQARGQILNMLQRIDEERSTQQP